MASQSVLLFASSTTSLCPNNTGSSSPSMGFILLKLTNYFQNRVSSFSAGNICPGWEEPQEIMLEEGGVSRTTKISPVGRLDAQNKGTNREKLENRSN